MDDDDPLLTAKQAAERAGVAQSTWRGYVARKQAPPADDPDDVGNRPENRRTPRWRRSTVDAFAARTKRAGARTDVSGQPNWGQRPDSPA